MSIEFNVLSLFPDFIDNASNFSILKRAKEKNLIKINSINPRDFTNDKHKKVDDTPYGGGCGMVLMVQPYIDALRSIEFKENSVNIILTPQGETYNQKIAQELALKNQINLICGHYEGFDERIRILSNAREISIGDYVLTGGELPALCLIDSVSRLLDGVLGKTESKEYDSFYNNLLEFPQYTKPRVYENLEVPDVLLSGNHKKISEWRYQKQIEKTNKVRPDLIKDKNSIL